MLSADIAYALAKMPLTLLHCPSSSKRKKDKLSLVLFASIRFVLGLENSLSADAAKDK
jgi:hypothetical protein